MTQTDVIDAASELFADGIDARVTNGGNSSKVTVEQCAEWRRRVRRHARFSHIADDEDVSTTTVSQHVQGECSHEVDEPAVSDGDGPMNDDILIGSLDGLTVGEAAYPDDAVILGEPDEDADERANRSLAEYAREADQ